MKKTLKKSKLTEEFEIILNKFIKVYEIYENGILIRQTFYKKGNNFAYHYYPQLSKIIKKTRPQAENLFVDYKFVEDLKNFKDFENVLSLRGGSNNTIWRITQDKPISVITHITDFEFNCAGINDSYYNLNEIIEKCKTLSYIEYVKKKYHGDDFIHNCETLYMSMFFPQEEYETFLEYDAIYSRTINNDKVIKKVLTDLNLERHDR